MAALFAPMTAPDWIAETTFLAQPPDAPPRPVTVRIGRPMALSPAEWACPVALEGLHDALPALRGADALQALTLAWQLVGRLLSAFVARGGRLTYGGGDPVPLASYGIELP